MDRSNHGARNPRPTLESAQGARPPDRASAASYPASETRHPDGAYRQKPLKRCLARIFPSSRGVEYSVFHIFYNVKSSVEKVSEISRNPDTPCYLRLREFA